jgi:pimeloyl-ACP methyl ester carboxylesterase
MTGSETTAFKAMEGAKPYPANFRARKIAANGVPLYVRVGGAGPAVVLLHGYGETGDMWRRLLQNSPKTTPLSGPTFAEWGCRIDPKPAMTKRNRAWTLQAYLTP